MNAYSSHRGNEAPMTEFAGTIVDFLGNREIVINDGSRNVRLPLILLQFFKGEVEIGRPDVGATYDVHLPEWLAFREGLI